MFHLLYKAVCADEDINRETMRLWRVWLIKFYGFEIHWPISYDRWVTGKVEDTVKKEQIKTT